MVGAAQPYLVPHSWHLLVKYAALMRSKQQKMGFSRSVSQHGSGVVVGEEVGAVVVTVGAVVVGDTVGDTVVGETVGDTVGDDVVGDDVVGLAVGQSVPSAVPSRAADPSNPGVYATPLLRGTTGPHSPAL